MWPTEIRSRGESSAVLGRTGVEPLRTPDMLLDLLDKQAGRCAVCTERLVVAPNAPDGLTGVVDRDFLTETVRGLLCRRCHDGLILFSADPVLLQRAAGHLGSAPGGIGRAPAMAGHGDIR